MENRDGLILADHINHSKGEIHMKRLIVPIILLTLALVVSMFAQQDEQKQAPPMKEKMPMMPGMMHGAMRGMGPGMMKGPGAGPMGMLNLTEEQQAKVQDLHLAHQKEIIPLQSELQEQKASLKLEITADKFNESKVKSIQGEISKLQSEMAMKMVLHQRAVRDLLTPEQKKKFDEHILSAGPMGPGPMMGGGMMGRGGMKGQAGMMGGRGAGGPVCNGACSCMQ
jgi:Spy/CpxP family protein refolding chaperone